ncbi:MAG TPA: hypothetical protein VHO03_00435 [Ignavibacteriales bacterium]|nr:hypothetical protein [Ignavibacteriales bacterium]
MKLIKPIVILLFLSSLTFAQQGGSVYSRFGIGELDRAYSARRLGLGELGFAVFDRDFVGTLNPAAWTKLNLTRFEVAVNFQDLKMQDNLQSRYSTLTRFSGFTMGVPLQRDWGLSLVAGITPYSNISYNIMQNVQDAANPYSVSYEGNGSMTRTFIGSSYTLPFDVNIGASLDYYIGNQNYYSKIAFENESLTNPEYQTTYKSSGLGGTFGIISNDFSKLFSSASISNLRLGATYSFKSKFDADSGVARTTSLGTESLTSAKSTLKLPMSFGAGLSFLYKNSYLFLLDYLYEPWSKYEFNGRSMANLRNSEKVSAGVEYRNTDLHAHGFFETLILRGALSYEKTQYQLNGKGVDQYSVYGGVSLPLEYQNTLDFGLQYSIRGAVENNLLKENIFKLNVSLSLGELWFLRPQGR